MTTIDSQAALDTKIKTVCDVLRRSNCAGALQYVPEISWLLFLRFLDERETSEAQHAEILGRKFTPSLTGRHCWSSWAGRDGRHRKKLQNGARGDIFRFLERDLLPHLRKLGARRAATPRQRLISRIVADVDETRVDTERNFLDVIDKIDDIRFGNIDDQHLFALSSAYEGLLLLMGEKNNDGGQFYTPREVVRAMVRVIEPKVGDKVYDPCCGTGGFLAQAYEHMRRSRKRAPSAVDMQQLAEQTFYGREKDKQAYPIALANLVLHGIDYPHIWYGNTLTGTAHYAGLFEDVPSHFEVILTNPPFGGKEGADAQSGFAYKTAATQVLFLQHVIDALADGGRCGMVVDEGLLFRTDETAFLQTKRKLLDECDVHCIVSLAPGVFTTAGSGVKTNILFFKKGKPTKKIWYYEVLPKNRDRFTKTEPLTLDLFDEFFKLRGRRGDSDHSWTVSVDAIKEQNYDLKAVNPHHKGKVDTRTPAELLAEIERHNVELKKALTELRRALRPTARKRKKVPGTRSRASSR